MCSLCLPGFRSIMLKINFSLCLKDVYIELLIIQMLLCTVILFQYFYIVTRALSGHCQFFKANPFCIISKQNWINVIFVNTNCEQSVYLPACSWKISLDIPYLNWDETKGQILASYSQIQQIIYVQEEDQMLKKKRNGTKEEAVMIWFVGTH